MSGLLHQTVPSAMPTWHAASPMEAAKPLWFRMPPKCGPLIHLRLLPSDLGECVPGEQEPDPTSPPVSTLSPTLPPHPPTPRLIFAALA